MKHLKPFLSILAFAALAACQSIDEVRDGQPVEFDGGLTAVPQSGWTQFSGANFLTAAWTRDGFRLNELQFWTGIEPGEPIVGKRSGQRNRAGERRDAPAGWPDGTPDRNGRPDKSNRPQEDDPTPRWDPSLTAYDIVEAVQTWYAKQIKAVGFESSALEPLTIDGREALKFRYDYTHTNDLVYSGMGLAIRDGENLHLLLFHAPNEHYFGASEGAVDGIFRSVKLKGAGS